MAATTRFIPVSEWAEHYPWPTPGALRVHICNAEKKLRTGTGPGDPTLLTCVVRFGARVLIDEQKFIEWMRQRSANACRPDQAPSRYEGNLR